MDVPFVNTFMGADGSKNPDDNWEEALRVWPDIVRFADDHGRKLTFENCPMLFSYDEWPGGHNLATTPRMWRRILETWGGTIGLNFDPSHLILQMIDIPRFIREFGPHILHVQAKDLMIDRDGLYERGILSRRHRLADPPASRASARSSGAPSSRRSIGPATTATSSSSTRTAMFEGTDERGQARVSWSRATSCVRSSSDRPRRDGLIAAIPRRPKGDIDGGGGTVTRYRHHMKVRDSDVDATRSVRRVTGGGEA